MNENQAINKAANPDPKLTRFYYKKPLSDEKLNRSLTAQEASDFCKVENQCPVLTIKHFVLYNELRLNERKQLYKRHLTSKELKPVAKLLGLTAEVLERDKEAIELIVYLFKQIDRVLK